MVGEHAEPGESEIAENLPADSEITPIHRLGTPGDSVGASEVRGVYIIGGRPLDFQEPIAQLIAHAFRAQIDQRAGAGGVDHAQRIPKLLA